MPGNKKKIYRNHDKQLTRLAREDHRLELLRPLADGLAIGLAAGRRRRELDIAGCHGSLLVSSEIRQAEGSRVAVNCSSSKTGGYCGAVRPDSIYSCWVPATNGNSETEFERVASIAGCNSEMSSFEMELPLPRLGSAAPKGGAAYLGAAAQARQAAAPLLSGETQGGRGGATAEARQAAAHNRFPIPFALWSPLVSFFLQRVW